MEQPAAANDFDAFGGGMQMSFQNDEAAMPISFDQAPSSDPFGSMQNDFASSPSMPMGAAASGDYSPEELAQMAEVEQA